MKKFIAILAITGSLAACNNAADPTEAKKDSIDSAATEVKDRLDSTGEAANNVIDSQQNVIDSSADAKKEAVDSMHKGH